MIDVTKIDTATITKEQLMELAHENPKWIIERAFWVVNKDKQTVPFIFNEAQNLFYYERTTRDDLDKAGQLGISTVILAILTIKFLLVPNSWSICISHEDEATIRLFEKVKFFLDNLPDWLQAFYVPGKTKEGDITNEVMHSKFYIGTAGARAFGRGDTPHYVHMSEISRWRDGGRIVTGLSRAVPLNDPHTWIVKETTANGEGTPHHIEYKRAKNHESEFRAHFIPFFVNPEYRNNETHLTEADLTDKEKELLTRFPQSKKEQNHGFIDIPVLAWRRQMIGTLVSEDGRTPEEMFAQEFPVDDIEAFLSTGNPIFSSEHVLAFKAKARPPIAIGNLIGAAGNYNLQEDEKGWLKLWDFPGIKDQFVIFADVGEFSDWCVATVVDRKTWKVIAKFRARMKSHAFGDELQKLGYFFNKAIMAVEVNNMGQSTVDRLVTLGYPNMYMRKRLDAKNQKETMEYGWLTTEKTKNIMIGHMQDLLTKEEIDIPDIGILDEFSTFVRKEDGSMGASPGNYDDQVMSCSGAYYILKLNPYFEMPSTKNPVATRVKNYRNLRRAGHKKLRQW